MLWLSAQALTSLPAVESALVNKASPADFNSEGLAGKTLSGDLASANPAFKSTSVSFPSTPNSTEQMLEVVVALAIVLAIIYGAAWLIKRNKGFAPSTGLPMKTLSVLPMGVKEKIVLVEIGGKQILLGMTPQQINTLATFDDPIIDSSLKDSQSFSSKLKDIINQSKSKLNNENSNIETETKA